MSSSSGLNWFYIFVAVLFAGMLFVSAKYFRGSGHSSVGITQAKEYKINSEKPSLVKSIAVVPGQQVSAGDLLIELSSGELEVDIERLTNRIAFLKNDHVHKSRLIEADVAYVKADQGITLEELESDIAQLESEIRLNKKLTRNLSADTSTWNDPKNPLYVKLQSLRRQKEKQQQAMTIREADIRQEGTTDAEQLTSQITLLERELQLLRAEREKLTKRALADGVVKSVFIKPGEQVDAFTPLVSITPVRPTTVVAYLAGKYNQTFLVGDSVHVSAYGSQLRPVAGKVIGYGSVSELPEILQKSTAVKAFGREVFIEIPSQNDFANGEKVLIR